MLQRLMLALALAGAGLATWGAQVATACTIPPPPPLTERLAAAPAAFVGTVIARHDAPPRPDGVTGSGDPVELRFRVERVYKGDLGDEVDVMTVRYGASCGLEVRPGDRVGLLLRSDSDGRWRAGLGDDVNTLDLEAAAQALAAPPPPPPDVAPAPPAATPAPPTARPRSARRRARPARRRAIRSRRPARSRRGAMSFRWTQTAILTR